LSQPDLLSQTDPAFAEPVFAERVFAEPWQAQAFALAVRLSEQGYFSWSEWAGALAAELKTAAERGAGAPGYAERLSRCSIA